MPIITIEALVNEPPDLPNLLAATARAAAEAFGTDVRHCWVTFRAIPPGAHYEGGRVRDAGDAGEVSPLVTVVAAQGRDAERKTRVLRAVAAVVGDGLGTSPDNVFVEYREIPKGHAHTGGEIR